MHRRKMLTFSTLYQKINKFFLFIYWVFFLIDDTTLKTWAFFDWHNFSHYTSGQQTRGQRFKRYQRLQIRVRLLKFAIINCSPKLCIWLGETPAPLAFNLGNLWAITKLNIPWYNYINWTLREVVYKKFKL